MFITKFEVLKITKIKPIKISRTSIVNFEMVYKIELKCGISGQNFVMIMFTKQTGLLFLMKSWNAKKTAVKTLWATTSIQSEISKRMEPSLIIYLSNFSDWLITLWKKIKENFVSALVLGPRKREVGLGVPATFTAVTKELTVATILFAEILKTKTKYIHFKLSFAEYKKVKQPMLE